MAADGGNEKKRPWDHDSQSQPALPAGSSAESSEGYVAAATDLDRRSTSRKAISSNWATDTRDGAHFRPGAAVPASKGQTAVNDRDVYGSDSSQMANPYNQTRSRPSHPTAWTDIASPSAMGSHEEMRFTTDSTTCDECVRMWDPISNLVDGIFNLQIDLSLTLENIPPNKEMYARKRNADDNHDCFHALQTGMMFLGNCQRLLTTSGWPDKVASAGGSAHSRAGLASYPNLHSLHSGSQVLQSPSHATTTWSAAQSPRDPSAHQAHLPKVLEERARQQDSSSGTTTYATRILPSPGVAGQSQVQSSLPSLHTAISDIDAVHTSHLQDLQHQLSTKSLALQILQGEHDKLLSAYNRQMTRLSVLDNKGKMADTEISDLRDERQQLQERIRNLQSENTALQTQKDEAQSRSGRESGQYLTIMSMSSKLQAKNAEDLRKWREEKDELMKRIDHLERQAGPGPSAAIETSNIDRYTWGGDESRQALSVTQLHQQLIAAEAKLELYRKESSGIGNLILQAYESSQRLKQI